MMLMVAGSRSIDADVLKIDMYMPEDADVIITGGEKGVDALAEKYADDNGIEKIVMRGGREHSESSVPSDRTRQMMERADRVLVFWDGKSSGSKAVYDYAKEQGKPVDMIILKMPS